MTTRSALLILGAVAATLIPLNAHRVSRSDQEKDAADRPSRAHAWSRHAAKSRNRAKGRARTTGTIRGYDPETEYEEIPELILELSALPPGSRTYVRGYPGTPVPNPTDVRILAGSEVVVSGPRPVDRTVVLKDVNGHFTMHARYVLEIVHENRKGKKSLYRNFISVDRTVILPGTIYTVD